jgi:hypothetical protein
MQNKGYLILLCQFLLFSAISAQSSYNKFVIDGVSWVISESYCTYYGGPCDAGNPSEGWIYTNTYYYKLEGDSLIDSVHYAKLFESFCANSCFNCGPPNGPPFYAGCNPYQLVALLTEDTINRKVFSRSINSSGCWNHYDSIFMDFSLVVGDSENLVYNMDWVNLCDTNKFIIDSTNYTGFQSYPVKTWYIRNTINPDAGWGTLPDIQLYEGIGYSYGFSLLYNPGDGTTTYARQLINYCEAGDNSCTSPYNSIGETPTGEITVSVIPNPASDFLIVKSANAQINKVEIIDINGRTMLMSSSSTYELNITSLAPDMYFLLIRTNAGVAYKRFIKI